VILGKDRSEEVVGEGAAFRAEFFCEELAMAIESIFDERESLLDESSVIAEKGCERFGEGEVAEDTALISGKNEFNVGTRFASTVDSSSVFVFERDLEATRVVVTLPKERGIAIDLECRHSVSHLILETESSLLF